MFEPDLANLITHRREEREQLPEPGPDPSELGRAKFLNAILTAIDTSCTADEVLAWPEQHYVSTADTCNIECHYCPRQSYYGDRWEDGFMPADEFREHVAPLARHSHTLGLYGLGEPFLHRHFFDFVRLTKEAGAHALTNCHGMSLKPKVNGRIVESELDQLNISMDGATEETFNSLRHGADLETVKRQVKDLARTRDEAGSESPSVYIAAMVNRENLGELPDIVRMAKDLGAEQVDFSDTVICNPEDLENCVSFTPEMDDQVARAQEVGRDLDLRVHYSLQKPFPWRPMRPDELRPTPQVCELAWGTWLVGKHGEVKPCCFIEWEYGNAFTDDPEGIRNGPEARELRRRLREGDLPRECHGCGCAQPLTEDHQRRKLDEAEHMLGEADLSETQREELRRIIAERRALVEERWGAALAVR